jgi:hypothetical protein
MSGESGHFGQVLFLSRGSLAIWFASALILHAFAFLFLAEVLGIVEEEFEK